MNTNVTPSNNDDYVIINERSESSTTSTPTSFQSFNTSQDEEIEFSAWKMFKRHIPRLIITVLADIALPLILYYVLQKHMSSVYALLIAGSPALIMVVGKAVWSRTFDAIGFLVFVGFTISAIVAIATKNARVLVLEKSLITAVMAVIFLVSLIPLHIKCGQKINLKLRPLVYYFYMDLVPMGAKQAGLSRVIMDDQNSNIYSELQEQIDVSQSTPERFVEPSKIEVSVVYNWIYTHCSSFRYACYFLTIIWAIGFLIEFGGRLMLIFTRLSINQIVLYANVILGVVSSVCAISSVIIIILERRRTIQQIKAWKLEYLHRTSAPSTHTQIWTVNT
ncbi:unnamed protein product [Didymodactylos carnosus]|uniref:Uncharacterized protein n=1 Tax=Didymodactylos carnosus TaxID=1234261 RepID=A0A815FAP5_9BILA|nr:unnamed protein product [Didymodactylos carnosus]CAF1325960.1 unnamed protein product [Didymodactylos carnosus]CAF3635838.1 unnamed protein product [Didymodactylos carnosus]CAF4175638.1 unnamed protein product [Didymodactylos carnosus]